MNKDRNIFPLSEKKIVTREQKENFLNQRSKSIWFTGLSGAGKSTLALGLEKELFKNGFLTQVLDGDNIRNGINNNLTFTEEDRFENIRRIAEVNKLLINCGIICINSFISPVEELRLLAKSIIGEKNFIEVYINAPLDVCEKRDVKGLYKKAREGKIKNFTGIDAPFEFPVNVDIEIQTDKLSVIQSVELLVNQILPRITY